VNKCRACSTDFASLAAFDKHRTGVHEYLWSTDLPDGRRCLRESELLEVGMELDSKGRWRMAMTDARLASLQGLRAKHSAQDATRAA
jgi:hypothetical protein